MKRNLIGKIFGRWEVLERNGSKNTHSVWKCLCSCGVIKDIDSSSLISGDSRSCGCLLKDLNSINNKKNWLPLDQGTYYNIPLTKNFFSKIDKEDYQKIKNYGWSINGGYAIARSGKGRILLHREILSLSFEEDVDVDHINHDTLDNRKVNLRVCFHRQNCYNRSKNKNNVSGVPGVYYIKKRDSWSVGIRVNYKYIFLGYFKEKSDAIRARKKAEDNYFGKFKNSNIHN